MNFINPIPTTEEYEKAVIVHAINGDLHVIPQSQIHQTETARPYVSRLVPDRGVRQ